jgi:hypothetical protein
LLKGTGNGTILTVGIIKIKNGGTMVNKDDAKWDEFDLKLYSAINKATGVELNQDPEIFELYCNLRDAIFNEYQ